MFCFFLISFILSKILFYFQEHAKAVNTNKNFELSLFPIKLFSPDSYTWILDIPCWILDIQFFLL